MPSKIQVDQIAGATGSTVTLPSGQTLDLSSGTVTLPSTALSALNASNLTSGTVPSARLSLTSSDLPTVPTTKGGTGLTTIGTAGQALKVNSGATGLEFGTVGGNNTPAFYVSTSASTTMSSAYTDYLMTFDTEVVDSDNCFNTTTYRFTPNVAGYYLLNVRIGAYWGYGRSFATSPHNLIVSIYKNGTSFRGQAWPNSFAQNCNCHNGGMTISTIAYANGSTDYFTIYSWADVAGYSMSGQEFSGFKLIGV
jgi:hypothetical protein